MPRIQLAGEIVRKTYRRDLDGGKKALFDELVELLKTPLPTLNWYHAIGWHIRELADHDTTSAGAGRLRALSEALGPSHSFLVKAVHFYDLYPTIKSVRELEAFGAEWSMLQLCLPITEPKKRHKLLKRALIAGWSLNQLRFEAQNQSATHRRGAGGRPRRKSAAYGPEATLHEMDRRCRAWLDYYGQAWSSIDGTTWTRFAGRISQSERDGLEALVQRLEGSLKEIRAASQEGRKVVANLKRNLK